MNWLRVVIAGGGTGGHIYPGLSVAQQLRQRGDEVIFVGTRRGLESDLVPRAGFPLELLDLQGLPRRLSRAALHSGWLAARALGQTWRFLSRVRPHVVLGTGGYAAGPVVLAAALRRIPTVIHEQNAVPGLTNRLLARVVDRVALGYEEAGRWLAPRHKLVVTGNPIRPEILEVQRTEGAARLGLDPARFTILILGGSQGARRLWTAALEAQPQLSAERDLQVVVVTGKGAYDEVAAQLKAKGGRPLQGIGRGQVDPMAALGLQLGAMRVLPYLYDMPAALAAADLVVGRAGAISLAEITARGLPAILVPYPYAAGNHQALNARVLEEVGAAVVIPDQELTGDRLLAVLRPLLHDRSRLAAMAAASRRLGKPDATKRLVAVLDAVAARHP